MKRKAQQKKPAKRNTAASGGANVRLLTVKQAAEAWQVSERHFRRRIKSGEVRVRRLGKVIRIHPKDLGL
jgi:excisionase family DNA binding protein